MNKVRRKNIAIEVQGLEKIKENLEMILDEEQDAFDCMPENLQYSERGEQSEEAIGYLEESISNIEDIIDNLNSII